MLEKLNLLLNIKLINNNKIMELKMKLKIKIKMKRNKKLTLEKNKHI